MDRQRLADALAYEQERRSRLAKVVPMPADGQPEVVPTPSLRSNVENLSIGLGEGLTNQLEGVKALVTDPIGTAKNAYEGVREMVRDPSLIAEALREMGSKATSGPLGAGEVVGEMIGPMRGRPSPDMLELDVYHGTPHRFPATEANPLGEFDASKIGTGEGAQAYGHGVYLAESPDIAKHYQTQLGKFYDQMQTPEGAMSLEEAVTKYHPNGKAAAKVLSMFRTKIDVDTFNKVINDEILPEIRAKYPQSEWGKFAPQQGTLYKADLPNEMIDRMLDWDKPLSEQRELATPILKELGYLRPNDNGPRQFAEAVKALSLEHGGFGESGATGMGLFNAIYKGLQQGKPKAINLAKRMNLTEQEMFMEASPLASEVMKRMGIPGIKYADAGSRGQGGSGTRNFVVFPGEEKNVRILERK
jgi:hypothetical protein